MAVIEDYPSNSFASKANEAKLAKEEPHKVEAVVQGGVKSKKKSEFRKIADRFVADDMSKITKSIVDDTIVPSIKKAISDMIVNAVDTVLYGESGRSRRSGYGSSGASRVSYRAYYEDDRRRSAQSQNRSDVDYDELIFDTRADADAVLDSMQEIISCYGKVSIADLYDLARVTTTNYTLNNYGWTDISGCRSIRVRDGYILKLPRPIPIK